MSVYSNFNLIYLLKGNMIIYTKLKMNYKIMKYLNNSWSVYRNFVNGLLAVFLV